VLSKNGSMIRWLQEKRSAGVEIMSLCTGAYFLAEAGFLNGLEAATHWQAVDELQARYPAVKFRSEKITIDQNGIITGGGATSSFNTVLYFIEKRCGKRLAIELSKQYGIDYGRNSQNSFAIFRGQRHHSDEKMHEAQTFIEEGFRENISVEKVAAHVSISRRNFIRRFKAATGLNPIEYIQRIKIEAAKSALEEGPTNIASLTYSVGYNDLKTFRSVFKKTTGYSPQEYQKRYGSN
jgi:transcriptional regulator GlxA family with amidase domain